MLVAVGFGVNGGGGKVVVEDNCVGYAVRSAAITNTRAVRLFDCSTEGSNSCGCLPKLVVTLATYHGSCAAGPCRLMRIVVDLLRARRSFVALFELASRCIVCRGRAQFGRLGGALDT